jgi:azurin
MSLQRSCIALALALAAAVTASFAAASSMAPVAPGMHSSERPSVAGGKVCTLDIAANDLMQFDRQELSVARACRQVALTLKHTGKLASQTMGHNWVLVRDADAAGVASDALAAGAQSDYVKPGDPRVIAHTRVVGGGQSDTLWFSTGALAAGESYTFECTYPGHSAVMRGKFIFG